MIWIQNEPLNLTQCDVLKNWNNYILLRVFLKATGFQIPQVVPHLQSDVL